MEEKGLMQERVKLTPEIIQKIVTTGDLSGLSTEQKMGYLMYMCAKLDLDPAAQPFNLISFKQGFVTKEVLYCTKAGAEQITKNNNVSHSIISLESNDGLYIVKARASMPDGRYVEDMGIVDISKGFGGNLPDNTQLANLMLKAVTKAKRRATLSLLGLGMMDETEVQTLPEAKVVDITPKTSEPVADNRTLCRRCGKVVTSPLVIAKSTERFGDVYCFPTCQNEEEKERRQKALKEVDAEISYEELHTDETNNP